MEVRTTSKEDIPIGNDENSIWTNLGVDWIMTFLKVSSIQGAIYAFAHHISLYSDALWANKMFLGLKH